MNLEGYISNYKNPPKKERQLEFAALELYYYKDIDRKKKNLIRETFKHISKDNFHDALEIREKAFETHAFYQSASESGIRGLVRIETCTEHGSYGFNEPIEEEKFFADYNSRYMVGEQKYKYVQSLLYKDVNDSEFSAYMGIYYTLDGCVFLDRFSAKQIENMSIDELGNHLADICIKEEERLERINGTNKAK